MTDKKRKKTVIDEKRVLFVRRYSEPEIGSYFTYSVDKEICNRYDRYKFYLKIGAVIHLPKKPVPGKKISSSVESILESNYFGGYIYYGETDRKIRCILYAKRKGMPDMKLVGAPSCLHSVIPRYNGRENNVLVTGMMIYDSHISRRSWSRYDVTTKYHHTGFFEILSSQNLVDVATNMPQEDWRDVNMGKTGIYVGPNTSLLMVDIGRAHLYIDYSRHYVYTLFQEGAFICTNRFMTFAFYGEEESEEYDFNRIKVEKSYQLQDSPNLERLWEEGVRDRIIFLKSAPNYTCWALRANKVRRMGEDLEMMLCFPTGGQFENVYDWEQGLQEVVRRQSLNPWSKYTEQIKTHNPKLEEINLDKNEAYPMDKQD